jgi:hypothetical protein
VTLTSKAFTVKVNKAAPGSDPGPYAAAGQQDLKSLGKDIQFLKTDPPSFSDPGNFFGSLAYYILLCSGPLVFMGALVYKNRQDKNNGDLVKLKSKNAGKLAAQHLAIAKKQLLTGDKKAFYEEIYRGLYGYLSDKLNISAALLNQETIVSSLRSTAVNEQLISNLLNTLQDCEMARYAPVQGKQETEVFENAKKIINDIENNV